MSRAPDYGVSPGAQEGETYRPLEAAKVGVGSAHDFATAPWSRRVHMAGAPVAGPGSPRPMIAIVGDVARDGPRGAVPVGPGGVVAAERRELHGRVRPVPERWK